MTEKEKNKALSLLLNVLKIPSVNGVSREADVAEFLHRYFNTFGIESQLQYVDEKRANVIAEIKGTSPNILEVWNGHIDTVPYGNTSEWNTSPNTPKVIENKIYARGSSDMKSGLVAMVYGICYMKSLGIVPTHTIRFIATCDEEKGGQGALEIIKEKKLGKPEILIIGEPTDCNIGIAQKGCIWIKLVVHGKTSHGAYPQEGINAIEYAYKIYTEFKNKIILHHHEYLKNATVAVTSLTGGTVPNMIPDTCNLTMDVRVVPGLSIEKSLSILKDICVNFEIETKGKLNVQFSVINKREAINTDPNNPYVKSMIELLLKQGLDPNLIGINYFTDASVFIDTYPDLSVLLLGPGNPEMAHKPNEYVEIDKYYLAIEVFKGLYKNINPPMPLVNNN